MPAGKVDLVIEQGTRWQQSLQYLQPNGTPFDLAGYAVRMQVRPNHSSDVVLLELDNYAFGGITVDTTTGTISIDVPALTTAALDFTRAIYDIELSEQVAGTIRMVEGVVTLSREVTR